MSSLWDRRPRSDRVDCIACGCRWFASMFDACPGCAERDEQKIIDLRTRLAEHNERAARDRLRPRSGNVQAASQRRPTVGESLPPSWLSGGGSAPSDDDDPGPVAA